MGRSFTAEDAENKLELAIVNETLARQYFAGRNPVGHRFGFGDSPDNIEIIGVVSDAKYFSLRQEPLPMAYYLWQKMMPARMGTLVIRTQGDARAAAASLKRAATGVSPDLLLEVKTLSSHIDDSLRTERMLAQISGFFGVLALALTCIGLYGIMAQGVIRRTREIGIRIALGAERSDVVWMVLRETLMVAAAGLLAGVPLAAVLTRLTRSFLFGVTPNDPRVLSAAVLVLLGISLLAGYLPARRASKVNAVVALRYE
jgi:ABC-type antimicrobial peptide transport system permease subunit